MTDDADRLDRARRIQQKREEKQVDRRGGQSVRDRRTRNEDEQSDGDTSDTDDGDDCEESADSSDTSQDEGQVDETPDESQTGETPDGSADESSSESQAGESSDGTQEKDRPAGQDDQPDHPDESSNRPGVAEPTSYDVLEFTLGDERYCLDINYVEEIVEKTDVSRIPNTPEHIEGVVDLRSQVTAVVNPKTVLDLDSNGREHHIIVFDAEAIDEQYGHIGWIVDDIRRVRTVTEADVDESPFDDEGIVGVINSGDGEQFTVWATPELVL